MAVVEAVVNASCRADTSRVTNWIKRVETPGIKFSQLQDPGRHFRTLATKLAHAISTKYLKGDFARRLLIQKKRVLRTTGGRFLSGREMPLMVYQEFRTDHYLGHVYSITELARITWLGDDKIEKFKQHWDHMIELMPPDMPLDFWTVSQCLLACLQCSTELKREVEDYRRRQRQVQLLPRAHRYNRAAFQ